MPDKEGAEEKTTKSVVNKKQKLMMGEEGYDHLRDQGRIRKNKKKKDATTMPPSKEMEKTRKVNKGPSALERVKADIEKRYGKDAIMKVKKESTELLEMGKKFGPGGDPIKKKGFIDKSLNKLKVNTPVKKIDTDTDVKTEEAKSLFSTPGLDKLKKLKDFKSNADRVFGRKSPDLTKVAEAFGGYIIEKTETKDPFNSQATSGGKRKSYRTVSRTERPFFKKKNVSKFGTPLQTQIDTEQDILDRINKKQKPTRTKPKRLEGPELKKEIKKITKKPTYQSNRDKMIQLRSVNRPKITGDLTGVKKRNLFPKAGSANTPAVKKVKSGIAKRLATQTKTAQKKIIKTVGRKAATKGIAKVGGKFVAKRIPGLGAIISGAEAVGKLATGDLVGAGLAAGEGILSSIPGVGTVASTALGGYSAVRDARRAAKAASTVRKVLKSTKGAKGAAAVKKAFKASPKITKKLSPTSKKGFKGFMSKVKDPKTAIGKTARIGGGVALDVATPGGITKKLLGLGRAAKPKVDGGHVGRRTAG